MTNISAFFPYVMPYVTGCPEPMARQAVVDAAIAFCEDSMVLQEVLPGFDTVVGQIAYELVTPSVDNQIGRILDVDVGGRAVAMVTQLDSFITQDASGTPQYAYTSRVGSAFRLNLYPAADAVLPVSVRVALRPTKTAQTLDDDLLQLWCEPVAAGALARLFSIPGQPFSNPAASSAAAMASLSLSRRARIEGSYARSHSSLRVRQRPFA